MNSRINCSKRSNARAMTLVEVVVAVGLGSIILTAGAIFYLFVVRSFMMAGNYTDMDARSRYSVDAMLQEMRSATRVTDYQLTSTNAVLTLTNSIAGTQVTYTWNADTGNLVRDKTGTATRTYLTECSSWQFELYQRTPHSNGVYIFYPSTNTYGTNDLSMTKLINMSWRCSRSVIGQKLNTENVQTAQVVLRNKQ